MIVIAVVLAGATSAEALIEPMQVADRNLLTAPGTLSATPASPGRAEATGVAVASGSAGASVRALREYLDKKEGELAQLISERKSIQREADALAHEVKAQKESMDLSWFERKSLERNIARLKTLLDSMERETVKERGVRDQAFACAAAIVAELEDLLGAELARLYEQQMKGGSMTGQVEKVMKLEKERKFYQRKADGLRPEIPTPAERPSGVPWSKEMVEDQRSAYEGNFARLLDEREQLVREKELRKSLGSMLPGSVDADEGSIARLDARISDYDRKIREYRDKKEKLNKLSAGDRRPGQAP